MDVDDVCATDEPLQGQPGANVAGCRVAVRLDRVQGDLRPALQRAPGLRAPGARHVDLEPPGGKRFDERDEMTRDAAVQRLRR